MLAFPQLPCPVADLALSLARHPVAAHWAAAFFLWVSVSLIARMWIVHRKVGTAKKLAWSLFLLVPVVGWVLYAAFFRLPPVSDCPLKDGYWTAAS